MSEIYFFKTFNSQEELNLYLERDSSEFDSEFGRFYFEQMRFTFEVNFNLIKEFDNRVNFINAVFEKNVSFENKVFKNEVYFDGCKFNDKTNFNNVTFYEAVTFPSFTKYVTFKESKFYSYLFLGYHFDSKVDFSYCTFKEDFVITDRIFKKELFLNDSTFEKCIESANTDFIGKVNAWNICVKEDAVFRWSNFRNKSNFSEIKLENGELDLHGTNFQNNAYFYNSKIYKLDLDKLVLDKNIFFLGSKIEKSNRESFRIIKNEFYKQNNQIEALNYQQREMFSYFKELIYNLKRNNGNYFTYFIKVLKTINDLTVLLINYLSNLFGLSWIVGVVFTFITTFLMFHYFLDSTKCECDVYFWKYYIQFISPIHKIDFIENVTLTNKSYIIDFFGRVLSSFGFYQTIQAFRKFGK